MASITAKSRLRPRLPGRMRSMPRRIRPALAIALVIVAAVGGGLVAMTAFREDRRLSVGTVTLSVTPFHRGALDLYVPLVDWGVRFRSVRFPARIHVDVRSVNRTAAARIAGGADVDVRELRRQADDQIGGDLPALVGKGLGGAPAAGVAGAPVVGGRAGA